MGSSHLMVKVLCRSWGSRRECVSAFPTHFNVGIFSVGQHVGASQLVSEFVSEGADLCVAVYLMHPWEKKTSTAFYVTMLATSPVVYFLLGKDTLTYFLIGSHILESQ